MRMFRARALRLGACFCKRNRNPRTPTHTHTHETRGRDKQSRPTSHTHTHTPDADDNVATTRCTYLQRQSACPAPDCYVRGVRGLSRAKRSTAAATIACMWVLFAHICTHDMSTYVCVVLCIGARGASQQRLSRRLEARTPVRHSQCIAEI